MLLCFHEKEQSFPSRMYKRDEKTGYIRYHIEKGSNIDYNVITIYFYYKESFSSILFPISYTNNDIQWVSIYCIGNTPKYVHFSGGNKRLWEECEFYENSLVVYVARNSHYCYPHSGNYGYNKCSDKGNKLLIQLKYFNPSYDYVFVNGKMTLRSTREPFELQTEINPMKTKKKY